MAAPKPRISCRVGARIEDDRVGDDLRGGLPGGRFGLGMALVAIGAPHAHWRMRLCAQAGMRLERDNAAAAAEADLRKLLRERFAIQAPCETGGRLPDA